MHFESESRSQLDRLVHLGFQRVGDWKLVENPTPATISLDLTVSIETPNFLYAFVTDGEVVYIGKSVKSIRQRLLGYERPGKSQRTNIRNNKRVLDLLSNKSKVDIYVFADSGLHNYGGFHMNLAAGLEDSLIDRLKPKWNIQGAKGKSINPNET